MSEIVEFQLDSGDPVYVQVTETDHSFRQADAGSGPVKRASATFEAAIERVKPAAAAVVRAFKELNEPDEIGLEFGLSFKTEANAFVFTGEANAAFKLTLTWKNAKS